MKKLLGIIFMMAGIFVFLIPTKAGWAKEDVCYFTENAKEDYNQEEIVMISKDAHFTSWYTFDSFPLVKEVRIEEGTISLEPFIFFRFPNVEKIVLPESLKETGTAFSPYRMWKIDKCYCLKKLKAIEVNKSSMYFASKDGALYTKDLKTLICYPAGNGKTTYNMPEFTMNISAQAFGYNTDIKKIVFGTRFTWPSGQSFSEFGEMPNICEIEVASDNKMLSAKDGVLFDYKKTVLLYYPAAKKTKTYTLPKTVETMERGSMEGATIGTVILPRGLRQEIYSMWNVFPDNHIGAFSIEGNSLLSTEDGVLYDKWKKEIACWPREKQVTELKFPSTLMMLNLNESDIPCLSKVTKLTIPLKLMSFLGWQCNDSSLKTIVVEEGNQHYTVYDGLLYTKDLSCLCLLPVATQKKSVTIPAEFQGMHRISEEDRMDSVTTIIMNGNGLNFPYSSFPNLTSIEVGKENKEAFAADGVLYSADQKMLIWYPQQKKDASFTVPDTVTSFEDNAFWGQKHIKTITFSKNLDLRNDTMALWFKECPNLENFVIPSGNKYYAVKDGILYSKDYTKVIVYPQTKKDSVYNMPDTVKIFRICSGNPYLKEISFGASFKGFSGVDLHNDLLMQQYTNLEKITVSKENKEIFVVDNVVYSKNDDGSWDIVLYPSGKKDQTYTIPSEVKRYNIYFHVLSYSPYLKEIKSDNPDFIIFGNEVWDIMSE